VSPVVYTGEVQSLEFQTFRILEGIGTTGVLFA
jgi:hypothetical protein